MWWSFALLHHPSVEPCKLMYKYKDLHQGYSSNTCLFSYWGSNQYSCKKLTGQTWSVPCVCPVFIGLWVIILSRWITFHQFFTVGHKIFGFITHASAFAICYFFYFIFFSLTLYCTHECKTPVIEYTRSFFSECGRKI